ncbi:hypothetical protein PRIC1_012930 [Phytophthora ramorum]|nr:hypothetical protein KRP22_9316 [Phytophthora ramorum]
MKAESELSDKEWRQMRRQMSKLEFEPVPETPALLPRSLYDESGKELESIEEQEENTEEARENALLGGDVSSNHHDSPIKHRSTNVSGYGSPDKRMQQQPETVNKRVSRELPSTSMAVSPLITSRYRPREQTRLPESKLEVDDTELAALDAQMAASLEAARRSVMGGFMELRAKRARSEAIERMKLSAAHTNDVAILQSEVKALKEKLARAEAQQEERDLLLDRFSGFAVKRSHDNQIRWGGGRSLAACFRGWHTAAQQMVKKRGVLHRVLIQSCKRQQLASFRLWKESVQGFLLQRQLQDQRDRYEHHIVGVAQEYQLKIQQVSFVV